MVARSIFSITLKIITEETFYLISFIKEFFESHHMLFRFISLNLNILEYEQRYGTNKNGWYINIGICTSALFKVDITQAEQPDKDL